MRLTLISTLFATISAPAFAHGAHLENLGGHSHMVEIVSVVAFGLLATTIIKRFAK